MNTINNNSVVGSNIKLLREKLGLTQEVLGSFLNTSREQIAYYEIGKRPISTSHLNKLASLFGMDEYDFYEENTENRKINIAFAFRADALQAEDLKSISQFKKIALNYIKMKNIC